MNDAPLSTGTRKLKLLFRCTTQDKTPVVLSGDVPELGAWQVGAALAMQPQPKSNGSFEWTAQIELPLGQTIEYKFVKKSGSEVRWESGNNHRITVIPVLHTLDTDFRD